MGQAKICVQAMTIKKAFQDLGPYEALKKMADIGYRAVELSQVDMGAESVAEMKRACDEFGIEVAAISGALDPRKEGEDALTVNPEAFIRDCRTLGARYIRIGMMPITYMASKETLQDFCRKTEEIAAMLKAEGIKLYYHNHHVEFQKVDGRYIIDLVREWAPNVGVELDVHWVQRGGEDPLRVIPRLAGSLDLLHLKDYKIQPFGEVADQEGNGGFPVNYFKDCVHFAEVGEGNLDMKAIIEAGLKAGSKYLIVEQDDTYGRCPYESLRISAENLKKMGYADCF